jgi:hypothetical protein
LRLRAGAPKYWVVRGPARVNVLLVTFVACATATATAQSFDEDVLQEDAFEGDPVGIGDLGDLGEVPIVRPRPPGRDQDKGSAPKVAVREGEVVRAVPALRETHHRVAVELREGLALVRHRMRFLNMGSHDAPVRYRLILPADAEIVSCDGCRTRWVRDDRGDALEVLVPPVPSKQEREVTFAYIAGAPLRGGAVRWRLPARGSDARAAPAEVTVDAPALLSPAVDGAPATEGPVPVDPWRAGEVTAIRPTADPARATLRPFPCEQGACARLHAVAGPREAPARDVILLIDASPSTIGTARNRMGVAFAALLGVMPGASRVQAVAFAAEAEPVLSTPTPPDRVPLRSLVNATRADLGAATRLDAPWATVRAWVRDSRGAGNEPLVVLVGDGGLGRGAATEQALAEAERMNISLHAVDLGDRTTRAALAEAVRRTGGQLVTAGEAASRAERGETTAALEERLRALFAPVVIEGLEVLDGRRVHAAVGSLRAGEEVVYEGPWPTAPSRWAARSIRPRNALQVTVAPDDDDIAQALAGRAARADTPREVHDLTRPTTPAMAVLHAPPRSPLDGKGIPKATVRVMFRQRLIPQARLCFRQDRRGRADHARRAEFVLRLAEREILEAHVEGELPDDLQRCLLRAVDTLEVPMFEGVVVVRYPVYTERAPDEPTIELEAPVADQVEGVTAGHPATPRAP